MLQNIKIAALKKEDIPLFTKLWNQDPTLLTSSRFIMTNEKALKGFNEKMFDYFGLYKKNKLIGFVLYQHIDNEIWLKHILIDKKNRKLKFGSKLLKGSLALYKDKEIKTEVIIGNDAAKNFFILNDFKILFRDEKNKQDILSYKTTN